MSDHFLRSLDDIREEQEALLEREMDPDMALISDYVIGELSEEKAREVRARIQKDPDFRDLAEPLLLAYEHGPRRKPMPREDVERKWIELRRRIGLPELPGPTRTDPTMDQFRGEVRKAKRNYKRRVLLGIAAVMVFIILPDLVVGYRTVSSWWGRTAPGVTTIMPLWDGSRATLSGGTKLGMTSEWASTTERMVVLSGEATFEIVPVPGRRFVVRTQAADVTVTGTGFTMHAYPNEPTQLSVTSGTVTIQARNSGGYPFGPVLTVSAGQRARATRGYPAERVP